MSRRGKLALAGLAAVWLLAACSEDGGDRTVTLRFRPEVGGLAFSCASTYSNLGTSPSNVTFTDFKAYISDVRLITASGREESVELAQDGQWQHQNVALLDFENGTGSCLGSLEVNAEVVGTVADGEYTGVRFVLGLPFDLNHGDAATAPAPLNSTDMFWVWNFGYKFLRADLDVGAGEFFLHLGSTGCNGATFTSPPTSCTEPNRGTITLTSFDVDADVIVVDPAPVLAASDVNVDNGGEPGCMSSLTDPECGPIFSRLGLTFGGAPAGAQALFRVEAQ